MLHNRIRDKGLEILVAEANLFVVCSQEPGTYAQAFNTAASSGYRLGSRAAPSLSISDSTPTGRRVVMAAFTNGTVDASGGGSANMRWALLDTVGQTLLATGAVTNPQ